MKERYRGEMNEIRAPQAAVDALLAAKERRPKEGGKGVIMLVATLSLLVCVTIAAAGKGWLDSVVRYGDNGALIEACSVKVGETVEGEHCDLTLEYAVTNGPAVYALFTARYDEEFLDMDYAVKYLTFMADKGADIFGQWRVDDGTTPGEAQFVAVTGRAMNKMDDRYQFSDFRGQTVPLVLEFLDDRETGIMHPIESYRWDVTLNESIPTEEKTWGDGTRAIVTPIMLEVYFDQAMPEEADWEAFMAGQRCELAFADGSTFSLEEALRIGKMLFQMGWESNAGQTFQDSNACHLWLLLPELADPEAVVSLTINGKTYKF